MREQRWESQTSIEFNQVIVLMDHLKKMGLKVRGMRQETACYVEEFSVDQLEQINQLDPWVIEEMTLVQINENWKGDFFLLAGKHHDLFRHYPDMEGYLSICHPWKIPESITLQYHESEALFWVGFRETHGFVRVRLMPKKIITPGETEEHQHRLSWISERAEIFSAAIDLLDFPLFVEWRDGKFSIVTEGMDSAVSVSWPDAFGPCQFEYVVSDRYSLLVPAAQLVEKTGLEFATVKTFLSGFSPEALAAFHQLQPKARMLCRGYIHASLEEFPELVQTMTNRQGRALINLCEFETKQLLPNQKDASAIIGLIGDASGFKIEIRLNRCPIAPEKIETWLSELTGLPLVYTPLTVI